MMYSNNNNNNFAFVVKASATDVAAIDNLPISASSLADGDAVLVDKDGNVKDHATALTAGDTFKIASKAGGELFFSPLLTFNDLTITTGKATAAAQQVTTIGSNGTTTVGLGDFAIGGDAAALAAVGNSYYVLIEKQDNDEANRSGYAPAITAQVKLDNPDGETAAEYLHIRLAEQLREAIRVNDQLEVATPTTRGPKYVRAEVIVVDDTTKATLTKNCVCVHGSKTISSHDGGNFAAMASGSYVVLGQDVYKTTSGGGAATFTIAQPFAGASQTIDAGTDTATAGFLTVANLNNLGGVGLRLTGTAQHSFDVATERIHSESRFNVRFAKDGENVGSAITRVTAADEGLGSFEQVATEEYHSFGQTGLRWVSDIPGQVRPSNADSTKNYGCLKLRQTTRKNNTLIGQTVGQISVHVWFELAGTAGLVFTASDNQIQESLRDQFAFATTAVGN